MISFEQVSKFILSDISIHIPQGTSVGIVGSVGAGKTTFLRLACGLLCAESGQVYMDGKNQIGYSENCSKKIGVLFTDKPMFDTEESVYSNFQMRKAVYRMSDEAYENAYQQLGEAFGFITYEHEKVKNLSLGQRRRAELGAVLLHNPDILLLDEPTNGLDENAKEAFRNVVRERTQAGMTVVISSHDLKDISHICQRIAVLSRGKLLYYGSEELLMRKFTPVDVMNIKLQGKLPNLDDLPLERYSLDGDVLTIVYNSKYITSAEILRNIVPQTSIKEVNIKKPNLADAIIEAVT